ncbi:HNH endonuclease [Bacillus toyonensis]|uniref:HNH endonuclease n=1 Tax=Bacillus toyonensis TaxID=155322 RepID=UPI00159BEF36|nr:HNH endonuclease [Bacillus toyonensis]
MNYFLVFQNKSYKEEREGGFLWAPQKNNKGQTFHHWTDMTMIKKGDIIFNSFKGELVSILVAKEDYKAHDKPIGLEQTELWEKEGWIVNAEYHDLETPIIYKNFIENILMLQGEKYAPFNKIGRGNTGYLFRVTPELAEYLFTIVEEENGNIRDNLSTIESKDEETILEEIEKDLPDVLDQTEKEQIIKSRIGHSIFKKNLLKNEKKCKLCGVSDKRFLIASHIKPWSKSNHKERLDINNGLLLCPNHDALFDKGYISFGDDGEILISASLDESLKIFLNVNDKLQIQMNEMQRQYMKWHREIEFQA